MYGRRSSAISRSAAVSSLQTRKVNVATSRMDPQIRKYLQYARERSCRWWTGGEPQLY